MRIEYIVTQGKAFLKEAASLMADGKAEDVLRHALSAHLPLMFPSQPWWIKEHVTGTESLAKFHEYGKNKYGFVDVLVGSTVIEYERNLRTSASFDHGLHQIKQYCAAQLNEGTASDLLVGVLSDTIHWHAFRVSSIKEISAVAGANSYGPEHIQLALIDSCDLSAAGIIEAKTLGSFLLRHLGREGGRQLAAKTLAKDLGFESVFCKKHLSPIKELVHSAFITDYVYAGLIKKLWTDFVSYLGGEAAAGTFDMKTYVSELYILTLAKLICANILCNKGLVSDDDELLSILDGDFFKAQGLPNLVEYDYFGWLNASPYVENLIDVARDIQDDLRAYDFESSPAEDLFGSLMAQLAARSQRLLLGQEWTPAWLAEKLVNHALSTLPTGQQPKFLDMCCGSGAMVIATVKGVQERLLAAGKKPGDHAALNELASAVTAFDIDPLAVMLAKVGWVLVCKDWLLPGSETLIPVYHADSLFANTPVTKAFSSTGKEQHNLVLDTEEVELPQFLIESKQQALFDSLLSRGYEMAMSSAAAVKTILEEHDIEAMVDTIAVETATLLTVDERAATLLFSVELLRALEALQRAGRNGIWAFVLRNTFRPALVAGRFNGIVTNPPWLAMSRIASNPYREALNNKADRYGIKAPGSSHLHLEIATTFMLHAIDHYLAPEAVVACILPDTVLNGSHHEPFRARGYLSARRPIAFELEEIWKIERGTFKNEAIVLFGHKSLPRAIDNKFAGREVGCSLNTSKEFFVTTSGGKTAWTTEPPLIEAVSVNTLDSVGPLFRQGADVMPRGMIFHSAKRAGAAWDLGPIIQGSPHYFLRSEGKVLKEFTLSASGVSDQVMFNVLISKHLAHWELAPGSKALLPFNWGANGWEPRTEPGVAALGSSTSGAIKKALGAQKETIDELFMRVDSDRKKLTSQAWEDQDYLVLASAGGKWPCAAYIKGEKITGSKTIIDQTLYWARVTSEDEAIYITALINSPAVADVILEHQPRGAFGPRHIHKLAFNRTPAFDPTSEQHIAVVKAARLLLKEWSTRRIMPDIMPQLEAQAHLSTRRKKIRAALRTLHSWELYEKVTRDLYEV